MPAPTVAEASPAGPTFTIGELAREFDLTTRAIRFYEDCGLITPQRRGRTRIYTARDRTRLKLTLRGKRLGLTLAEVKEIVDMYESPRDTQAQLRRFLVVLGAHRQQLEQQLADLNATLDEVRTHEKEARRLLAEGERRGGGADTGASPTPVAPARARRG
ncbi:MAG: MerR family DNA-binding transcriptional regulator [Piscinibacter sp.]|nr:MerR family DNA-binding transcriptional regulator [Piscinibacter sp.]